MTLKRLLGWSILAFAVALAVVVGNRMSGEAMAVVIGTVCGVAASIPTSAIVLVMSRRSRPPASEDPAWRARPPVVVVTPQAAPQPPPGWMSMGQVYAPPAVPSPREYRIVGDEPL